MEILPEDVSAPRLTRLLPVRRVGLAGTDAAQKFGECQEVWTTLLRLSRVEAPENMDPTSWETKATGNS